LVMVKSSLRNYCRLSGFVQMKLATPLYKSSHLLTA
jgi:hypothetical protein